MVSNPAIPQAARSQPGEPTSRADSAEVMKIPEPIIEPMTIIEASTGPSARTSFGETFGLVQAHRGSDSGRSVGRSRREAVIQDFGAAANAWTSAMACSIASRRHLVRALSRARVRWLARLAARRAGVLPLGPDLGEVAVVDLDGLRRRPVVTITRSCSVAMRVMWARLGWGRLGDHDRWRATVDDRNPVGRGLILELGISKRPSIIGS